MAYRSNIDDHSSILDHLLVYIEPGGQFILFSLLVGLGYGDVGNNDQNVTSLCLEAFIHCMMI